MEKAKSFTNTMKVSVPYRGATFLNSVSGGTIIVILVSVPYRGATFLNLNPIGSKSSFSLVSVPDRGATFLNNKIKTG